MAHTLPYDLALVGDSSVPVDRLATISVPTLGIYGSASLDWAPQQPRRGHRCHP